MNRFSGAAEAYRRALALATVPIKQEFLNRLIEEMEGQIFVSG